MMARAYQCDRCKCLYEPFEENLNPTKDHMEDYVLEINKKGIYSDRKNKIYDLCPKCYGELVKFVFEYEVEKAESEDKE